MRKKVFFGIMILFSMGCVGCGNKKENKPEETLTVCVEEMFEEEARNLLDYWETIHNGIKGEVFVIPSDSDTGEITVSNIRTELMSGEGPDVFLLSTRGPYGIDSPGLFQNPEKVMHTDTFLPLDDFLKQASYATPENLNSKILETGKTKQGQMILPITYRYPKYAFHKTDLNNLETLPVSWDELKICDNPIIQNGMFLQTYSLFPLFGKLADYESGKLLFSEEELQASVKEVTNYITWNEKQKIPTEDLPLFISGNDSTFYTNLMDSQDEFMISGFPSKDGGFTAEIITYAAINRNTTMQEEAFSFLDLVFRPEILFGPGVKKDDKWYGSMFFECFSSDDRTIHNQDLPIRYQKLSEKNLAAIKEADNQINAVCFYSDLEKELDTLMHSYIQNYVHNGSEKERNELVSKAYETMKMKVLE